jgi:hypothetical protein
MTSWLHGPRSWISIALTSPEAVEFGTGSCEAEPGPWPTPASLSREDRNQPFPIGVAVIPLYQLAARALCARAALY